MAACSLRDVPTLFSSFPPGPEGRELVIRSLRDPINAALCDYVFIGWRADSNRSVPVFLHKNHFASHPLALGGTRRGKTQLFLVPTILQLLARGHSVVFIDLKGDDCAAGELLDADLPELRGRKIVRRYYSAKRGESGCLLNLLIDPVIRGLPIDSRGQLLSEALGGQMSEGHGVKYFNDAQKTAICRANRRNLS
jgi:hypothetical protein